MGCEKALPKSISPRWFLASHWFHSWNLEVAFPVWDIENFDSRVGAEMCWRAVTVLRSKAQPISISFGHLRQACKKRKNGWWFGTCFFSYIGNNHPNWLTNIFQRGSNHQPEKHRKSFLLVDIVFCWYSAMCAFTEMCQDKVPLSVQGLRQGLLGGGPHLEVGSSNGFSWEIVWRPNVTCWNIMFNVTNVFHVVFLYFSLGKLWFTIWLVVWNIFYFSIIYGMILAYPSHWLSYFSRWLLHHQPVHYDWLYHPFSLRQFVVPPIETTWVRCRHWNPSTAVGPCMSWRPPAGTLYDFLISQSAIDSDPKVDMKLEGILLLDLCWMVASKNQVVGTFLPD